MNEKGQANVQRSSNTTKIWSFCMRINLIVLLKSTTIMLLVFCNPTWILVHDCTSYNYNEWLLRFPFSRSRALSPIFSVWQVRMVFSVCVTFARVRMCVMCNKQSKTKRKKSRKHGKVRWMVSWIACFERIGHTLNKLQKRIKDNKQTHAQRMERKKTTAEWKSGRCNREKSTRLKRERAEREKETLAHKHKIYHTVSTVFAPCQFQVMTDQWSVELNYDFILLFFASSLSLL